MYSIYHFFKAITEKRTQFLTVPKLENFPFEKNLLSCRNSWQFPDMAIRIAPMGGLFTGGEFIELKDSGNYAISSFNSTIPTGKKEISKVLKTENSLIKKQMEEAGDVPYSLPMREVYYLVRGRKGDYTKVVLVHGSFFETVTTKELISQSFSQVLEERLQQIGGQVQNEIKDLLITMFSEQDNFSKVRNVHQAAVTLRFRIMTEVKSEGNILDSYRYPLILDNSLNFVLPYATEQEKTAIMKKMVAVFGKKELEKVKIFSLKHHFDGYFLVFQLPLRER